MSSRLNAMAESAGLRPNPAAGVTRRERASLQPHSILLSFLLLTTTTQAAEWSGNVAIQSLYFPQESLTQNNEQHTHYLSASTEPEFYHSWNDDNQSLTFKPFIRLDQHDRERSHGDIRELVWQRVYDDWELTAGISKVYWGVTESQHLVDVINQTDFVESLDGEDKLGQPMLKTSIERDWGLLNLFILPGFRERSFAGIEGRPRSLPYVDTDQTQYESSKESRHIDFALRWLQTIGNWEIGLSHFNGTSREPVFLPGTKLSQPVLIAFYPQMQQTGVDIQATTAEWLWKLELISRHWLNAQLLKEHFVALTAGFEYTFVGIHDSDADLGLVMEYLYDDRGNQATGFFENDLMMGLRLAINDAASSEALLGFIVDMDSQETLVSLEASRRLGDSWKLEIELRSFQHVETGGLLQSLRKDHFIRTGFSYFF